MKFRRAKANFAGRTSTTEYPPSEIIPPGKSIAKTSNSERACQQGENAGPPQSRPSALWGPLLISFVLRVGSRMEIPKEKFVEWVVQHTSRGTGR